MHLDFFYFTMNHDPKNTSVHTQQRSPQDISYWQQNDLFWIFGKDHVVQLALAHLKM